MNENEKFMLELTVGFMKAIAHTNELTFTEFLEMFDTDDDYNTFVSGIEVVTKTINGILYVIDFNIK